MNFNTSNVMASFDTTSLFTNILLDNQLFDTKSCNENFTCKQFTKLLNLSVKSCHFMIKLMALQWDFYLDHFLSISFYLFMRSIGLMIVLLNLNCYITNAMSVTPLSFFALLNISHFSIISTQNTQTFGLPMKLKLIEFESFILFF